MTTNYLKFDTESEAAAAVDALRNPARGMHAKVADNPLFVEFVFNAPEEIEVADFLDWEDPISVNPEPESYADALERFRAHVEAIQPRHEWDSREGIARHNREIAGTEINPRTFNAERFTDDGAARVTIDRGRKYDKIVRNGSERTVHSFVNRETGEVLKAASWKAPAKHARGTIYGPSEGYGVQWTGANYL